MGTSFEELSKNWKAETSYLPRMKHEEREKKLAALLGEDEAKPAAKPVDKPADKPADADKPQ